MFLFNKFILGRVQASKPAVVSVFGNQDEDAATALLKLTLEPNVTAPNAIDPSSYQAPVEHSQSSVAIEPAAAAAPALQASQSEMALVICVEEPNQANGNAAEEAYTAIEGETGEAPSVEPQAVVQGFETVDGSEGNDVFGPPPSAALQATGNSAATENNGFGTIDGSEGNDALGHLPSGRLPFPTDIEPTYPVICLLVAFDPLLTVRQEYEAAIKDGSEAAMELFLARHPGVEFSTEFGVTKYDIVVTMPNVQNEWLALS
jgi:hypothetical protein